MNLPKRMLANLAAVGMLVAVGVVHGGWTGRWVVSRDLQEAVKRLATVPERVGDWTSRPFELDARQIERAGIAGYVARRYEARDRGEVTVLLVCGPPGPIAVHSPEVCYSGAGYEPEAFPAAEELAYGASGKTARLLEGVFRKKSAAGSSALRVGWTFCAGGNWDSPANPRLAYATRRALYKLYMIQELAPGDDPGARGAIAEFAPALLLALDDSLCPRDPGTSPTKATSPARTP